MSTTTKTKKEVNNSINLPEVDVTDNTQTKGKVSGNFNLNNQTEAEEELTKIDKNQLFSVELKDFFCPVKFDDSEIRKNLEPLVKSGILSTDAMEKAITTAKSEFLEAHAEEIESGNNLTFAEVLAKLQENKTLYNKVLTACKVSELEEANYISDNKVMLYRANQCTDKDGNNRYTDVTLKAEENGIEFTAKLFVEYRDITTDNILLAIRWYTSKLEAQKSILNQLTDYRRILSNVRASVVKAKENKFSKDQILQIVEEVYSESI